MEGHWWFICVMVGMAIAEHRLAILITMAIIVIAIIFGLSLRAWGRRI